MIQLGVALVFFGLPAQGATEQSGDQPEPAVAFVDVSVVPMDTERVLAHQTVVVAGALIREVGPVSSVGVPNGARVLDGTGKFLLPGLCDMHVHFRHTEEAALLRYLEAGITTVREMNGRPRILEWRRQIRAGLLNGPQLFVACPAIGNWSSPNEGYPTPTTRDEGRARAIEFADAGYDWIKFYSFVPRDAFFGLLEGSRARGIPAGGHVPVDITLQEALDAGVTSIEHLMGYVESAMTPEAQRRDEQDMRAVFHAVELDPELLQDAVEATVEKGVWNCPTICYFDRILPTSMVADAWAQPELRALGKRNRREIVRRLHAAGAKLVVGTDSDDGDDLVADSIHDELDVLIECELTPFEALRAATVDAARCLGREGEFGCVLAGQRADLLLVDGNPLEDLRVLRDSKVVMNAGRISVQP